MYFLFGSVAGQHLFVGHGDLAAGDSSVTDWAASLAGLEVKGIVSWFEWLLQTQGPLHHTFVLVLLIECGSIAIAFLEVVPIVFRMVVSMGLDPAFSVHA